MGKHIEKGSNKLNGHIKKLIYKLKDKNCKTEFESTPEEANDNAATANQKFTQAILSQLETTKNSFIQFKEFANDQEQLTSDIDSLHSYAQTLKPRLPTIWAL